MRLRSLETNNYDATKGIRTSTHCTSQPHLTFDFARVALALSLSPHAKNPTSNVSGTTVSCFAIVLWTKSLAHLRVNLRCKVQWPFSGATEWCAQPLRHPACPTPQPKLRATFPTKWHLYYHPRHKSFFPETLFEPRHVFGLVGESTLNIEVAMRHVSCKHLHVRVFCMSLVCGQLDNARS